MTTNLTRTTRQKRLPKHTRSHFVRLASGVYAEKIASPAYSFQSRNEELYMWLQAIDLTYNSDCIFRGASAAFLYDVPLMSLPTSILLSRPSGIEKSKAMNTQNNFPSPRFIRAPEKLVYSEERKGLRVVSIEQAIADCSQELPPRQAVSTISSLLHLKLNARAGCYRNYTSVELNRQIRIKEHAISLIPYLWGGNGNKKARSLVRISDGRCESPYEGAMLHFFAAWGFPRPILQHHITFGDKHYYADFAWKRYRVIVEFDGYVKTQMSSYDYTQNYVRDDILQMQKWRVFHVTKAMLDNECELAMMLSQFFPPNIRARIGERPTYF